MVFLLLLVMNGVLIFVIASTTKTMGLWGNNKASKKATKDAKEEKARLRTRARIVRILGFFEWLALNYGFEPSKYKLENWQYRINRLEISVPYIGRLIKPLELAGIMKLFNIIGIFMVITIYVTTGSLFELVGLLFLFANKVFDAVTLGIIMDEDAKLDAEFPELYFALYHRLVKGTDVRLAPTLRDFLLARDTPEDKKELKVILNFVTDLLRTIHLYGDDSMAIKKLREKYNSVTYVNFSNLAVQALSGVDNADKLLSYRMELQHKNNEKIKIKADKAVRKGQLATWAVLLILFKYIGVTIYLKASIMW